MHLCVLLLHRFSATASYYTSVLILIALAIICVLILLALQLVSMKALFEGSIRPYYGAITALLRLY